MERFKRKLTKKEKRQRKEDDWNKSEKKTINSFFFSFFPFIMSARFRISFLLNSPTDQEMSLIDR